MWFRQTYPDTLIFAIPNGGLRSKSQALKLKVEGVVPGIPDLFIPAWMTWVEMKKAKGGVLSKEQQLMIKYCQKTDNIILTDKENKLFLTIVSELNEIDQYIDIDENHIVSYNYNNPFFIHAPAYGYLDNVIIKLGYNLEESKIKNEIYNNYFSKKLSVNIIAFINYFLNYILVFITFIIILFYLITKYKNTKAIIKLLRNKIKIGNNS
jgi:hypothetical protein